MTSLERSNDLLVTFARSAAARFREPRVLDIGCGDGERVRAVTNGGKCWGIEGSAPAKVPPGVEIVVADLEKPLPVETGMFDLIIMNQVVEHIRNLDVLFSECRRILQPRGSLILATPNLASWHNIVALVLGQQAFSQSISQRYILGNRFSRLYRKPVQYDFPQHCHILTAKGIEDLLQQYGFRKSRVSGVNFFPLSLLEKFDTTHSQYLVVEAECA